MGVSTPVIGFYDQPMWAAMAEGRFELQRCSNCATIRYPPGPTCPKCLSVDYRWEPMAGDGRILSWVVFHRTYFDDHPAPYNVVAVQLEEGPIVMTNLVGEEPQGSWIGRRVRLGIAERGGRFQHHATLVGE